MAEYTKDEIMTVTAANLLKDGQVCFVGIGLPSAACNLARLTHAPNAVLIYESGTIETNPDVLPLSIGDGELAETASHVIPVPEVFKYWLQAGKVDIGFLGGAQIDKFGNINSTVIGEYENPKIRLPGAGGAPEIASNAKQTLVVMRHSKRAFVDKVDFITSAGYLNGGSERGDLGIRGEGPAVIITDLGILKPDPKTKEFYLESIHPGVTVEEVQEHTGWDLKIAEHIKTTPEPSKEYLNVLRDLNQRTEKAHAGF
ncbi:MAG: 3-oxoadipate--succinyl-CoA transferase subunit B [Balneola sp.]|jgi:glutaconate CoA-transferase subunit B|nr:3-oxoadipate--succinyl-CoA transferase subunit B [Balneola sp.]MBE78124.1 3-oxoadipate--succinyl-CoA transferase subunit B [Balneola sp.]|tara:strand:+ start:301 stop:1071 length:771 start_codon:yes stop_codon:yes gene_type:complete